jgi:hypothetical protein
MKLFLLIFFLLGNLIFGGNNKMSYEIIPAPKSVEYGTENFQIGDKVTISIDGENENKLSYSSDKITETLQNYLQVETEIVSGDDADIIIQLSPAFERSNQIPTEFINEAYFLEITPKFVKIEAATAKGAFYAAMSLIQLLEKAQNKSVPAMKIVDYPDLKVRGISDDISRGQVSRMDNFKRIIDHIARYKMNTYMPYMEDVLQLESFPTIGVGRGALSRDEVKEIIEYAEKNFIEVVPIFQTLGHYENILSQDEFLEYAEFPGAASLNVSSEKTYEFLETMLKEVFEMFPSKYFHMGADESWDVGLGATKERAEETSLAEVHVQHYIRVHEICKKYGKEVLMYGDVILNHPEILEKLPKDIIVVDWHYHVSDYYPSAKTFEEAGHQFYVSPAVWNFLTTFPTNINAMPNIKYITKSGIQHNAGGMINSNWGDYGAETFKELILFGYAWSAQCAWNLEKSDQSNFAKNYFYDFFGSDDPGLPRIYETMSHPFNHMMWHEVWRHPLLSFREPVWWEPKMSPAGRVSWIDFTMDNLQNELNRLEKVVTKNKDHFEIISFLIDLNKWYKTKLEAQFLLHRFMKEEGVTQDFGKINSLLNRNINSLWDLKSKFVKIWMKYYKKSNLNMVEDKFDRLIAYFEETKDQLIKGSLIDPAIPSKWIYHPDVDDNRVKKAKFKKDFKLSEKPNEAFLQFLGDTYVQLYINGNFVDQVYARRSLSLLVDYRRIKFIDVTNYLNEGENSIEIVAENFNRKGRAGFNLITNFASSNSDDVVLSDESWQVTDLNSDEESWEDAVSQEYRYPVIAPNFETKRTSWIER